MKKPFLIIICILVISVVFIIGKTVYSNSENQISEEPYCKIRVVLANENNAVNELINRYFNYLKEYSNSADMEFKYSKVSTIEPKYSVSLINQDADIIGANPFRNLEFRYSVFNSKSDLIEINKVNEGFVEHNKAFKEIASVSQECKDRLD